MFAEKQFQRHLQTHREKVNGVMQHQAIIIKAAKTYLEPHGFQRKGRSRTWIRDNGFWGNCINFKPSAWTKGAGLEVAATWFWFEKDHLSWDHQADIGPDPYAEYQNLDQFAAAVDGLAKHGLLHAERLQTQLADISRICEVFDETASQPGSWPLYEAAVANGLAGNSRRARDCLTSLLAAEPQYDWEKALHGQARLLREKLLKPAEFMNEIQSIVNRTRGALGLQGNWVATGFD